MTGAQMIGVIAAIGGVSAAGSAVLKHKPVLPYALVGTIMGAALGGIAVAVAQKEVTGSVGVGAAPQIPGPV